MLTNYIRGMTIYHLKTEHKF